MAEGNLLDQVFLQARILLYEELGQKTKELDDLLEQLAKAPEVIYRSATTNAERWWVADMKKLKAQLCQDVSKLTIELEEVREKLDTMTKAEQVSLHELSQWPRKLDDLHKQLAPRIKDLTDLLGYNWLYMIHSRSSMDPLEEPFKLPSYVEDYRSFVGHLRQRLSQPPSYRVSTQQFTVGKEGGTLGRVSEDGYQLQISKDALPPYVDLNVSAEVSLGNPHKQPLPEGQDLVSGVLHMQTDRDVRVRGEKDAAVQVEHCVNISNEEIRESIGTVMAHGEGPYENVDKRQVEVRRSSVLVWLKEVTSFYLGVVYTVAGRRFVDYCGILYSLQREASLVTSLRFHFIVVKDLSPCIKAVKQGYQSEPVIQPLPVSFAPAEKGEDVKLQLDIEEKGVLTDGWRIKPVVFPSEILESDAYSYLPTSQRRPLCELKASWKGMPGDEPRELNHCVKLKGTKRPKSFLVQYEPAEKSSEDQLRNIALCQCRSLPSLHDSPANEVGSMPQLSDETMSISSEETSFTPELRRRCFSQFNLSAHDKATLLKKYHSSPYLCHMYSPAPTLEELIKFEGQKGRYNILEEIGIKYKNFGILLLQDKTGALITAIEWKYHYSAEWINREILMRWIQGKGKKPVTWETLVGVLEDIGMRTLANDIKTAKCM